MTPTRNPLFPLPQGTQPRRPVLRRRRSVDRWDRRIARIVCVLLALAGISPVLAALIVRSAEVRGWVARQTQTLLRDQGIVATYAPSLRLWPLAVALEGVRVDANDGGPPVLECARVLVRPKLFALLAGKLAIDEIDLDEPKIRAVIRDGKIVNLNLPDFGSKTAPANSPIHAPFSVVSVTEASVNLDVDGARLFARSIDVDATADDDPRTGSTFELAVHAGEADLHRPRPRADGTVDTDDDSMCSLEARVRVEPGTLLVRRLDMIGFADMDASPNIAPSCDTGKDDARRVELSLGHLRVGLASQAGEPPSVDGHVRARIPLRLAERVASVPPMSGWAALDADVRYAKDTLLPDVSGTLEAHGVTLAQYSLAQELHSVVTVRRNVVRSPLTTISLANGTVSLSDTVIDPLAGGKLEATRLDAVDVDFTTLMRDLGVHPNSWVGWDVRELHVPLLSGTFAPLKLEGDLRAKTYGFGVYDRPAEDKARERLFGFAEAQLAAHIAIRSDAIAFLDLHAKLPHSRIDGGFVSIGFHNDLLVDVPNLHADLDDLSPIGNVPIHGILEAKAHVGGKFNHPEPEGDIQSATSFVVADVAFGDVTAGHVRVDTTKPEVELTDVRAKRRDSPYSVPSAKLRFGGNAGFVVDAVGASEALGLRDLLSMFALDDDPRFEEIDATIAMRADVHVALGGPEDACGGGYVGVNTKGHLSQVSIFGERFAGGDADVALHWYDRQRGLPGADVDVRSFVLNKVAPPAGRRPGETGTVLGSASVRRGGAVAANLIFEDLPLSRVDLLGHLASQLDGRLSGVAHVTGNVDDFQNDAGLVSRAEIDVTGLRARGVPLPNSHLDVRMTDTMAVQRRSVGRSRCGAPIGPPFDKQSYADDTSSHGEWGINGDLLGDTVHLRNVVVTRARSPQVSGRALLRGLNLGAFANIFFPDPALAEAADGAKGAAKTGIDGQIWGELIVDDLPLGAPSQSRIRFFLGPTVISRAGQKIALTPPPAPIALAGDVLTLPPLAVALETQDGFHGGFVVTGGATKVWTDPTLALQAKLEPVDLAILKNVIPRVDRASGRIEGNARVSGRAAAPVIAGELHMTADDLEIRGAPSAITDVRVDVNATATDLTATGKGSFAGGAIEFQGSAPIRGFDIGALESRFSIRGVHLTPMDGVSVTFDSDLELAYDRKSHGAVSAALPRVTGSVTLGRVSYTRPITFNLDLTSTRAKRTEVNAYDPALDFVTFDIAVRSHAPIQIRNNLVEVQLGIDSGMVEVTGTNQRVGLRGSLKTIPGGRFHFQANDFEVQTGVIRFDDPTRIAPNVDVTAVTEYRRYTDTSAGAGAGAASGGGAGAAATGSTRGGSLWRIMLHAYGDADNVRIEMTSEPALSQEDIALLLLVGMTRAELDQLQAGGIGESVALNVLGAASGADRAVKQAVPIIDDFRFGSAYSTVTGKTEPQLTVGKRLTNDVRASVTAGLSEDRELRSNIEWRLNGRLSVQGSYDNINDVSSSVLGNLGVDLRWRLEFE